MSDIVLIYPKTGRGNLCQCGCGRVVNKGRRFIYGHNFRVHSPVASGLTLKSPKKGLTYEEYYGEERATEIKQKLANDRKGKRYEDIFTTEKINKMKEGRRKYWLEHNPNDEIRGLTLEQRYGKKRAEEIKLKMSIASSNPSEENRQKKARAMRERWQNPDFVQYIFKCRNAKPNKTEMMLSYIIRNTCPHIFKYNGDCRMGVTIGSRIPDFVDITGQRRVIELFGEYFHDKSEFETLPKLYREYGYKTLIIWCEDLYRGLKRHEVIKRKLLNFVNCKGYYIKNGRYYFNLS